MIYSVGTDLVVLADEFLLKEEELMLNIADLAHAFNVTYLQVLLMFIQTLT